MPRGAPRGSPGWLALQARRPCGARTRRGTACRGPAVRGRARCRMHGGAAGSGAPRGNTNRRTHGRYARATIARRRQRSALIADANATLREFGRSAGPDCRGVGGVGGGGGAGRAAGRGETERGQVDRGADGGRQREDRRGRNAAARRAAGNHPPRANPAPDTEREP